jgi:hypothetical protein
MGSANLTWDGLGKNLELAWYYATDEPDEVYLPHLAWLEAFTAESTPVTTHDLTLRARFRKTAQTWGNKGRINIPSMIRGALPFGGTLANRSPLEAREELDEGGSTGETAGTQKR